LIDFFLQGATKTMARCDQGYLCRVCGLEVEELTDSELYLRYVIHEIDSQTLIHLRDCHLTCNPVLAQFIDDPRLSFDLSVPESLDQRSLDQAFVMERRLRLSEGYRRLWEIRDHRRRFPHIQDYPLPRQD
jgi:hypothetical protein